MKLTRLFAIVFTLGAFYTGCGRNDSVKNEGPSADAGSSVCGSGEVAFAKGKTWSAKIHWNAGPKMGLEDLLENRFCLTFKNSGENLSSSVKNVTVIAHMPAHGHDTGREKPMVDSIKGPDAFVSNLYFIMTGYWEMIITADVDGAGLDEARVGIDIRD
ncbi:MAG: hypothetical protein NT027_13940 [Proteobacteria bacterium]|nr:hypothetical protein [Pseudomonadota bacterium]